ncbi:hypothetical protein ACWCPS_02475 [Streptomyces mauvecolor]
MDGLHAWMFAAMRDRVEGRTGIDVDFVARSEESIGATILGRNMFGPDQLRDPSPLRFWYAADTHEGAYRDLDRDICGRRT